MCVKREDSSISGRARMKHLLHVTMISCLLHLLAPVLASAQVPRAHAEPAESIRLGVGAKLGMSFARFIGDDAPSDLFRTRSAVTFGGAVSIGLNRWLSLQPEIQYAPRGAELGGGASGTVDMPYLAVPLVVNLELPVEYVTPRLQVGIVPSMLLSADVIDETGSTDFKDSASSYDVGLLVGIGASVTPVPRHSLVIEGRYERGLISIDDSENATDRRHHVYTVALGYQYSLSPAL